MTGAHSTRSDRHRWLWRSAWSTIIITGLGLSALQAPYYQYGFGFIVDDELMVEMTKGFLDGHWSSAWSSTGVNTLAKPVGYPLFLAAAHFLPWTPLLSTYGIFLGGVALIAWGWRRISGSRTQATVVLAALVLNPVMFASSSLRIYRDTFIDAIATVAIGLAFMLAASLKRRPDGAGHPIEPVDKLRHVHRQSPGPAAGRRWIPYVLMVLLGLLIGFAAITKPTWQWLMIAIAAPLVYPLFHVVTPKRFRWMSVLKVGVAVVVVLVSALSVVEAVKYMNSRTYKVALEEDLSGGALARAWKLWASVEAGPPKPYIAISDDMRMAVYAVSPTAATLKPFLEAQDDPWKRVDCRSKLRICNDSGPWFEWDLRDASAATGEISSVLGFQHFFSRVANDISSACATGRLKCSSSPVLATGLPTVNRIPPAAIASYTARGLWDMARLDLAVTPTASPTPVQSEYKLWRSVVPGLPSIRKIRTTTASPWIYSVLRIMVTAYGYFNLLLAIVLLLGPAWWAVSRALRRQRPSGRANRHAATASGLFFVAALVGMATLAVFDAAVGGLGFTSAPYWTDFATPAELCLVFGAFASWPIIAARRPALRRSSDDSQSSNGSTPQLAESAAPRPVDRPMTLESRTVDRG